MDYGRPKRTSVFCEQTDGYVRRSPVPTELPDGNQFMGHALRGVPYRCREEFKQNMEMFL